VGSIARTGSADNPVRLGHSRGGIAAGFVLPAFVYATLTGDEEALKLVDGKRDLVQEFSQSSILTAELAPRGYSATWNGQRYDSPCAIGDVVWADTTVPAHRANGSNWLAYRWCCSANAWHGWALFADAVTKFSP